MSLKQKIKYVTKAAAIAVKVFPHILNFIRPGMTEKEISSFIYRKIKEFGGDGVAFRPIVSSGRRSALIHGYATQKKIKVGDSILLDYGVKYRSYRSDISRTVYLGKVNKKQRKLYQIVLKAQHNAAAALHEGADCADIDNHARKIITKAGFGKTFRHSTGHGLSKKIHDAPRLGKKSTDKLKNGDIVTVEPGIYVKGFGGVRIEDDYLVTKRSSICLTKGAFKAKPMVIKIKE